MAFSIARLAGAGLVALAALAGVMAAGAGSSAAERKGRDAAFRPADPAMRWSTYAYDDHVGLAYAIPETDAVFWSFECAERPGYAEGEFHVFPAGLKLGRTADATIAVDELSPMVVTTRLATRSVEGADQPLPVVMLSLDDPLFEALARGYVGRYAMGDIRQMIALTGSGRAIRRFQAECRAHQAVREVRKPG